MTDVPEDIIPFEIRALNALPEWARKEILAHRALIVALTERRASQPAVVTDAMVEKIAKQAYAECVSVNGVYGDSTSILNCAKRAARIALSASPAPESAPCAGLVGARELASEQGKSLSDVKLPGKMVFLGSRDESAIPEGWVLVPREPAVEMIAAWYRTKNGHHFHGEPPPTDISDYAAYRAMLIAAPPAPVSSAQSEVVEEVERLRKALLKIRRQAASTRGEQAYRELPKFIACETRAALAKETSK